MPVLTTLACGGGAVIVALLLGVTLGAWALRAASGAGFVSQLCDVRGGMPAYLTVPFLVQAAGLPSWSAILLSVGTSEAIALARWLVGRQNAWSPALAGTIALGQSSVLLVTRHAATRGAVTACLAGAFSRVLLLEGLLTLAAPSAHAVGVGGWLVRTPGAGWLLAVCFGGAAVLGLELLASRLLKRRR